MDWLFDSGVVVSIRWIWVGLFIILSLIEIFTLGLYTIWFAIAALIMAFLAAFKIALPYQFLIYLVISAALLFGTRPLVIKKFRTKIEKTNVDSLAGMHALVTRKIGEFDTGEVKLNGQFWTARAENNCEIQEGVKCEVVRIEGVQAIVRPLSAETN